MPPRPLSIGRGPHANPPRLTPLSDRDSPEGEPALELGLERQLGPDLGLQAQLALGVALLLAARRRERVERAALVVVDPVDVPVALVAEREHRAQDALAVTAALERRGDRVDADHQILEVRVG